MNAPVAPTLLGQQLISKGMLNEDQLRIALHEQSLCKAPLGKLLVKLGFISENGLRDTLSQARGASSIELGHLQISPDTLALLPEALAKRHQLLPISWDAQTANLVVAMANIDDLVAFDALRAQLPSQARIEPHIASPSDISRAIEQHYGYELAIEGILTELETGRFEPGHLETQHEEYSAPIIRLINALLADAVQQGASDIHFEPEAGFLRLRYRIDGLLKPIRVLHRSYWPGMVVRLKVMGGLNIAESRAPQDGRFSQDIRGREIDFRIAVQPTMHGENIVLRLLDRHKGILPLAKLGLAPRQLETLKLMSARPEGILLITGPTGSGKTTSLYSIINHISHEGINIMTLEDPVEYPMPLIRQTSIAEAARMDFASGIRSMMRQDPDVILVGEIRDAATAEMAFRAAMTGHQVLSTLHTNSALGAIPRLLDIGVLPDIMAGNIIGVIAQRLVRKLCVHCRQARPANLHERRLLKLSSASQDQLFEARGCPACAGSGYKGRIAIMELLRVDSDLDELITRRASMRELRHAARDKGFEAMADDGIRRILDGSTSLNELMRVIDMTERIYHATH